MHEIIQEGSIQYELIKPRECPFCGVYPKIAPSLGGPMFKEFYTVMHLEGCHLLVVLDKKLSGWFHLILNTPYGIERWNCRNGSDVERLDNSQKK